jgi:hypothetical protein
MPRVKPPFELKQQGSPAVPVPLTAAVQSWLLVRGLNGGPHRQSLGPSVRYKATGEAGQQAQLLSAQILQELINVFNF